MTAFYEPLPLLADTKAGRTQTSRTLPPQAEPSLRPSTMATACYASRSRGKSMGNETLGRLLG